MSIAVLVIGKLSCKISAYWILPKNPISRTLNNNVTMVNDVLREEFGQMFMLM